MQGELKVVFVEQYMLMFSLSLPLRPKILPQRRNLSF